MIGLFWPLYVAAGFVLAALVISWICDRANVDLARLDGRDDDE